MQMSSFDCSIEERLIMYVCMYVYMGLCICGTEEPQNAHDVFFDRSIEERLIVYVFVSMCMYMNDICPGRSMEKH
jgi:hypothetical protein